MIKKITTIFVLLIVLAISIFCYRNIIIINGSKIYLMKKNPGTFNEVFYNVTNWKATEYAKHPRIGVFIFKKMAKEKLGWKKGDRLFIENNC